MNFQQIPIHKVIGSRKRAGVASPRFPWLESHTVPRHGSDILDCGSSPMSLFFALCDQTTVFPTVVGMGVIDMVLMRSPPTVP
jgi:hypothetical protein